MKKLNDKIDKNFKDLTENNKHYYNLLIENKNEINKRSEDNLSKFNNIFRFRYE